MSRLFFGKISGRYPQQFDENFYAAGKPESEWYNGIQPGDFVFPIYKGQISKLWVVREYTDESVIDPEGMVRFDVVKEFKPIRLTKFFIRQKFFELDLNLINKSMKSSNRGFFEISLSSECPEYDEIDFEQTRKCYISFDIEGKKPKYNERDIRVLIDQKNYKIISIDIYKNNTFEKYEPLWDLYCEKNPPDKRYSIQQLLDYAGTDIAVNKIQYLKAVIESLKETGWFDASNPVHLYDNLIVGRRKTPSKLKKESQSVKKGINEIIDELESQVEDVLENYSYFAEFLENNPNLILYGPPGTGKTYTAQKIIEYLELKNNKFRPFREIADDDRVEFITFHQSYSYEEFVEGIRPTFDKNSENETQFVVEDGIVKRLANRAALNQLEHNTDLDIKQVSKNSEVYKISLGQRHQDKKVYEDCIKEEYIAIGWLKEISLLDADYETIYEKLSNERDGKPTNDASSIDNFVNQIQTGDIVFIYDGPYTIRDIGVVAGDYYFEKDKEYPHRREVKWLRHFEEPLDISRYNSNKRLTLKTVYPLNRIQLTDIMEILNEDEDKGENKKYLPCYLIIDEINRGNISKIFGELITLIEKDKRDTLKVTLPYSRKSFKMPSNIFIIGTMNTADRSIAILDTALRRRFTFCEIEPDSSVLEESGNSLIEGMDLSALLDEMNRKITKLYDRDHRIGHSYFMGLYNFKSFYNTWYYKIIPLLMEYFYNDVDSVAKIISDKFINKETSSVKLIEKKEEFISAITGIYEG